MNRTNLRLAAAVAGICGLMMLSGCAGFFVDTTTTGGTGSGTTTGSGDYAFVVNQTTNTLSGYSIGSGALTLLTGSPYALVQGLAGASVEISRANTFVYVGGTGAIECFRIGTSGALTLVNSQAASASARFASLTTSPDGQWLLALDSITQTLYVFGINSSTGALTLNGTTVYGVAANAGAVVPTMIRISPNGLYAIAALGTGGDVVFPFNTTTGVASSSVLTLGLPSGYSDNAVAIDANSAYVYFARGGSTTGTSGVASYSLASNGGLTQVQARAVSGNAPFSVLLDSTGGYAYVANRGDGTISGYSVSGGTLTALGSSPFGTGNLPTALARDNSGKYVVAASFGGSSDVSLYSFDATVGGKLNAAASGLSGVDPAGSVAVATTR